MPRAPRMVAVGVPHHVTQRANRGENAFFTDEDRWKYLNLLGEYAAKHDLKILAFCLMRNHVHLVAAPGNERSLGAALGPVHMRYAQYVNRTQGLEGVLWRGRPYSCPLDDRHFWAAVRYVERNAVRAGVVARAEDYPWSSARAHCGLSTNPMLAPLPPHPDISDWFDWLSDPEEDRLLAALRHGTRCGSPVGDDSFIHQIETARGRQFPRRPRGRPPLPEHRPEK